MVSVGLSFRVVSPQKSETRCTDWAESCNTGEADFSIMTLLQHLRLNPKSGPLTSTDDPFFRCSLQKPIEFRNAHFSDGNGCFIPAKLLLIKAGVKESDVERLNIPSDALNQLVSKGLYTLSTRELRELEPLIRSNEVTLQEAMLKFREEAEEQRKAERAAYRSVSADHGFADMVSFGLYGSGEKVPRILLEEHQASVFNCCWNPVANILATCSHSGTANIWDIEAGTSTGPVVLPHPIYPTSRNQCNPQKTGMSCLAWHPSGEFIATSICDSMIHLWDRSGTERAVLQGHKNRIVAMKWNKAGTCLLSAGLDSLAIAWDPKGFNILQKFYLCPVPMTDVDWMDNETFALCCHDKTIQLFKLGKKRLQRAMFGHTKEITMIRWHPAHPLLASSSEDGTVKIWSPDSELCITNLAAHTNEIFVIVWNPDVTSRYQLASASADKKIRLWNIESKQCLQVLSYHENAVICADFSPDGQYLVSTCFSQWVCLWDMQAGSESVNCCWCDKLDCPAFDLRWNKDGDKLAATLGTKCAVIFDFSRLRALRQQAAKPAVQ